MEVPPLLIDVFFFASKKLLRKHKCIWVNVCLGCFGADTQKLVSLLKPGSGKFGSPQSFRGLGPTLSIDCFFPT